MYEKSVSAEDGLGQWAELLGGKECEVVKKREGREKNKKEDDEKKVPSKQVSADHTQTPPSHQNKEVNSGDGLLLP